MTFNGRPESHFRLIALGKKYFNGLLGMDRRITDGMYRLGVWEIFGEDDESSTRTRRFGTNDPYELRIWMDCAGLSFGGGNARNASISPGNSCWALDLVRKRHDN